MHQLRRQIVEILVDERQQAGRRRQDDHALEGLDEGDGPDGSPR